jgi:hypothetical protein
MKYSLNQLRVVTRPRSGSSATAKIAPLLSALGCLVALLYAAPAQAQTRTWVSGVGNDANPCSRTAPCKTFAGAISKTAAGGEINCLDPGGFGAVTITKAITIACEGVTAGVVVPGTNGIIVNAGASDNVTLRGIDINGDGTGLNGIRFLAGKALIVDNCQIYGFTTRGIDVALGAAASVDVKDTRINNIGGAGIRTASTVGNASLSAERVNISRVGTNGVEAAGGGIATVKDSFIFAAGNGIAATGGGGVVNLANSVLMSNNVGANATVAGATVALTNNALFANNTAVAGAVGGNFISGSNNKLSGNNSNGSAPSATMTTE